MSLSTYSTDERAPTPPIRALFQAAIEVGAAHLAESGQTCPQCEPEAIAPCDPAFRASGIVARGYLFGVVDTDGHVRLPHELAPDPDDQLTVSLPRSG